MARKFFLLGESLGHTMSPPIHRKLFELSGKGGDYGTIELPVEKLVDYAQSFKSYKGYNITIPHKINIIPFLDKIDSTASRYGAVNCVNNENGISTGYNTDVFGFLRSLEAAGEKLEGKVLLVGCGGAGRMMGMEVCLAGAELTIAVRKGSLLKAEKLKTDILKIKPDARIEATEIGNINGNFHILINSTPVGMYPHTEECPVDDNVIKSCDCVFDAIYNPVETLLIRKARAFGKNAIGGMAMLVWQAVAAHEIWDSAEYREEDISSLICEIQDKVKRDF